MWIFPPYYACMRSAGIIVMRIKSDFWSNMRTYNILYLTPDGKRQLILRLDPIEAAKKIGLDEIEDINKFLQDDLLIIGDIELADSTLFFLKQVFMLKHLPIAL